MNCLEISNLQVTYRQEDGKEIKAVNGFSCCIPSGKIIGLIGESGCGKTTAALSIMRLQEPGEIKEGQILYGDKDICQLSNGEVSQLWGKEIAFIFQNPGTSLNPVLTIGRQIKDILQLKQKKPLKKGQEIGRRLQQVGLPAEVQWAYPHQLSGGMQQRAMLAMVLACQPKLLIADEPTTGLDVLTRKQILDLLLEIQQQEQLSMLVVTHDLLVAASICDEIILMYQGRLLEQSDTKSFFAEAGHPYKQKLLSYRGKHYA